MRREDDTRQPQTETDAADTSEYLSIVLFILSVTSHPKWSAGHGAAEGVALNTHTHAMHVAYFHDSVWCVFLWVYICARGWVCICLTPARRTYQAVDDAFEVFSFFLSKRKRIGGGGGSSVHVHKCVTSGNISNLSMLPQPSATPSLSLTPTPTGN